MYEPLMFMRTTNGAHTDFDGALVESAEYVAAEYESTYADQEWRERYPHMSDALYRYADTAQYVAEELYVRDIEEVQP